MANNACGGDELGDAGLRVERVVEVGAGEARAAGVGLRALDAVVRDRAAILARLAASQPWAVGSPIQAPEWDQPWNSDAAYYTKRRLNEFSTAHVVTLQTAALQLKRVHSPEPSHSWNSPRQPAASSWTAAARPSATASAAPSSRRGMARAKDFRESRGHGGQAYRGFGLAWLGGRGHFYFVQVYL